MNEAIAFLTLQDNIAFSVSLALMAMLGLVSALGVDFDTDFDADVGGIPLLDWALPGRLPMLVGLAILLAVYGLVGLAGQQAIMANTGSTLGALTAALAAILPAVIISRPISKAISRIMPKDESSAIQLHELISKRGHIEYGTAREGYPARATFIDRHGQMHLIMVEPDVPGETLTSGQEVMLISIENGAGRAIAVDPRPDLGL
jgi:hypothetical protein